MSGYTPTDLPRAAEAAAIVRALVASGRGLVDNPDEGGIWDDGTTCAFCGFDRWDSGYPDGHLTSALHDLDCLWRRAVEWHES